MASNQKEDAAEVGGKVTSYRGYMSLFLGLTTFFHLPQVPQQAAVGTGKTGDKDRVEVQASIVYEDGVRGRAHVHVLQQPNNSGQVQALPPPTGTCTGYWAVLVPRTVGKVHT